MPDNGNPCDETNPDSAVDVYFVIGSTVDSRKIECSSEPDNQCTVEGLKGKGVAWKTTSNIPSRYSGYAMVDIDGHTDVAVLDTIAHELAHISQFTYDAFESNWLHESSATWVAYKVMKALEKRPVAYTDLKPPQRDLLPVFPNLHKSLTVDSLRYGAWLFFYSASIDLGDNIVKDVWEKARRPGPDHIFAVDAAIPLIDHFARARRAAASEGATLGSGKEIGVKRVLVRMVLGIAGLLLPSSLALADAVAFKLLPNYSRATFKSDAPLETFVGNTADLVSVRQ